MLLRSKRRRDSRKVLTLLTVLGLVSAGHHGIANGEDNQIDSSRTVAAAAMDCTVPGSHDTIQSAVDDDSCDTIGLTAASYTESIALDRSLTLTGLPSEIAGTITVTGLGTYAAVDEITLLDGPLFADGFEGGDTSRWSDSVSP